MFEMMQAAPLSNIAEFTVSELSSALKRTVEDAFGHVRLRGEISGYRGPHSSGHAYLCLKDDRARIDGVIWRGTFSGLKFKPEEGLEVIVTGRVTTFPGKSSYQIVIEQLEPAGVGALMALLEERKKKLAAEGLFDEARKRPLPFWPQKIGIVTSPTGAVIRDMLHGFTERCPAHVVLWPVRVQGETCAGEVAAAINGFNAIEDASPVPRPDLIIVARGGGSLEDLWGFNEEIVVRAAAASRIPIISAVGHETDWTLIDLVADTRAPTPTKAAEWAVPRHNDLVIGLSECIHRARVCVRRYLEHIRAEFRGAERGLPRPAVLLAIPRQRMDNTSTRLVQSLRHFNHQARAQFDRCAVRVSSRLILNRILRCHERLSALGRHSEQAFRGAVHQKHLAYGSVAARFSPRLAQSPLDKVRDHLVRTSTAALRAFTELVNRKHTRFEDRSERLKPTLLTAPIARQRERFFTLAVRSTQAHESCAVRKRGHIDTLAQLLRSLSHKSVLERGFALVRDDDGHMVPRAAALLQESSILEIEFADGRIPTQYSGMNGEQIKPTKQEKAFARALRRTISVKKQDDGQGNLL